MEVKNYATVIFDRRKKAGKTGLGDLEFRILLSRTCAKYIFIKKITQDQWNTLPTWLYKDELERYNFIVQNMIYNKEELSVENLNNHLGIEPKKKIENSFEKQSFITFYRDRMNLEGLAKNSLKSIRTTLSYITECGFLKTFKDLTMKNVYRFDDWLLIEKGLKEVNSRYNHHKYLKKYSRLAAKLGYIQECPYARADIKKGHNKEREPLTEDELIKIRDFKLTGHLEHARDLFIFSAYTGMAYADVRAFDFKTWAVVSAGITYIDSSRCKTKTKFYTPILPPAMQILEKYNYHLPIMSNQKCNDYLREIKTALGIRKKVTFHVARHTFATLCLSYDTPIADVKRMLGHKHIRTTEIYAKILNKTVENEVARLSRAIR